MIKKYSFILSVAAILLVSCISNKKVSAQTTSSLKETFKNDFLIGTAINTPQIEEKDAAADALIKQQFNAVTPENIMKAEIIEPEWNKFNFDLADNLVAYAAKNNIKVNAHNLIWHSQLPAFMRHMQDADSVKQY